jgi:putative membrane protein
MMGGGWLHGFGFGGMGLFGGWIGLILNIAFMIGIVILIVWAVKRFTSGNVSSGSAAQTPREIVQARYARGEITRDQYQQMLSDLN